MFLIGNGRLFTRDEKNSFFENGAVVWTDNTIVEVGDFETLKKKYADAEFIDAKGGVIHPAFINTHEHIYSALARGLSIKGYAPNGFLEILDGLWWTIDRNLDNDLTKLSAEATYLECIKNGVTTIFDHHASFGEISGSLFAIEEAARDFGVRSVLCYEISDRDGKEKAHAAIKENVDFAKHALSLKDDFIKGMMGMHASFTISDETMELCRKEKPKEIGYHIHVAEDILDLHRCLKEHGKRIVDRLYDWDVLGEKTLLAHCIYVNPHEMDLIRDTNTMVVHNPESNMGNACGCPPTMEIVHKGILTGLGTDGYTHDMIESWKVANILHKHHLVDPGAAWAEVPEMLFQGNARIANRYFEKKLGVLEKGAAADIIITDYIPPTPMNAGNLNGHMLFGMNGRSVVTTVGNGKVLMKNRELQGIDEERCLAKIREGAARLEKKING
ncbi:putative aminohydrolase SsnA [Oribacterium sinus]|mgnify:FL=1|jgi:putative selenium metabolism protein ssnA|uniref:Putative selenium metabolism protein SsnA n=2 Tax=Oribacterium sinus TaxID=237576 RepID=C2KUR4_9FIRM|nr:putative aminohydrolase SsnA [Oribacterium sinus]EEJ52477.1 putative selenium metabolism protein SsnA [Oribacterium sinus F0268]